MCQKCVPLARLIYLIHISKKVIVLNTGESPKTTSINNTPWTTPPTNTATKGVRERNRSKHCSSITLHYTLPPFYRREKKHWGRWLQVWWKYFRCFLNVNRQIRPSRGKLGPIYKKIHIMTSIFHAYIIMMNCIRI